MKGPEELGTAGTGSATNKLVAEGQQAREKPQAEKTPTQFAQLQTVQRHRDIHRFWPLSDAIFDLHVTKMVHSQQGIMHCLWSP
jgi:hypothetical protein